MNLRELLMNLWYMLSLTFFSTEIVMDLFILLETTTPTYSLRKRRGCSAVDVCAADAAVGVFKSSMNGRLCVVIRALTGVEFGHHPGHFAAALTNARRIFDGGYRVVKAHFVQIGFFFTDTLLQISNRESGEVGILHDRTGFRYDKND